VLETLIVTQLVRKFFAFHGIRMFITVFRSPHHKPEALCNFS